MVNVTDSVDTVLTVAPVFFQLYEQTCLELGERAAPQQYTEELD